MNPLYITTLTWEIFLARCWLIFVFALPFFCTRCYFIGSMSLSFVEYTGGKGRAIIASYLSFSFSFFFWTLSIERWTNVRG